MAVLRERIFRLVVGDTQTGEGFEVTGLNVGYDVNRSADNKKSGNSGSITVYNLTADHRHKLEQPFMALELYVGYKDTGLKLLVSGEITDSGTRRDGPNLVTQLVVGEGYVNLNHKKIAATVAPGKTVAEAFDAILAQMPGISKGPWVGANLSSPLIRGYSMSGPVKDQMHRLASAYGFEYSVANNVLTITGRNEATNGISEALLISETTGMIGLPFRVAVDSRKSAKDKTRQFGIQTRILCDAAIYPGMLVRLESEPYKDWYRVQEARYYGEYRGNAWYCDLLLRDPQAVDITPKKSIKNSTPSKQASTSDATTNTAEGQ